MMVQYIFSLETNESEADERYLFSEAYCVQILVSAIHSRNVVSVQNCITDTHLSKKIALTHKVRANFKTNR
jgi:hypothetical protein